MATFSGVADVKNTYRGTSDADTITGNNLADRLYGQAGNDTITGAAGADIIDGGLGDDNLTGGTGNDKVYGGRGNDTYNMVADDGVDTIIDSAGTDIFNADFLTTATSGVYIKRGNDLIIIEGSEDNTGTADPDGDANAAEVLDDELTGVLALGTATARKAGIKSIIDNMVEGAIIKNYFAGGNIETINEVGNAALTTQEIMSNLVDYSKGALYFNQGATTTIVRGTNVNDYIATSANNQTLYGYRGDDVYHIGADQTGVVINDNGGTDTIVFADDTGAGGTTYRYTKNGNDLLIELDKDGGAFATADSSVTVKNFFTHANYQVEVVGDDNNVGAGALVNTNAASVDALDDNLAAVVGTTGVLRGTIVDDDLTAAAGGQTVQGLAGEDTIAGAAGVDRLYGGDDADDIDGGASNDYLNGGKGNDTMDGGAGNDTLRDVAGDDQYTWAAGKDTITDSKGTDTLIISGKVGANEGVYIKKGNDLYILDGQDDPDGGGALADTDALVTALNSGAAAYDTVQERKAAINSALDTLTDYVVIKNYFTTGKIETITDGGGNLTTSEIMTNLVDYSTGLTYFNQGATAGASVKGTTGADYIVLRVDQSANGGRGNDVYEIDTSGETTDVTGVEITDTSGTDTILFDAADFTDALDTLSLTRSGRDLLVSYDDNTLGDDIALTIKNYYKSNVATNFTVGSTATTLEDAGANTYDLTAYTAGSANADTISANTTNIWGNAGDDSITGGAAANTILGGAGADTILGGDGADAISGEAGDDRLAGGAGADTLTGGAGVDTYVVGSGETGDSIVESGGEADTLIFSGADFGTDFSSVTLTRTGDDLLVSVDEGGSVTSSVTITNHYVAASAITTLSDGTNTETFANLLDGTTATAATTLTGTAGADTLATAVGVDTAVNGLAGGDTLTGNTGADTISGGAGDDTIDGAAGADVIDGGLGDDDLTLGAGNDVVVFDLDAGTAAGADTVADFTIGEDVIRFTTSAADTLALDFRNQIGIWSADDSGASDLEIGYNWSEATQSYTNVITLTGFDGTSETASAVIEFVAGSTTYTLTDTAIETLLDEIVTGDNSANLAAVHDDAADFAGQQLQMIVASWA